MTVSVIIPIYNLEDYLEECLESLHRQRLRECEFLLVDDGSDDGSAEICARWCDNDSRFRYIKQRNLGVSAARDCGLMHANGDWVAFVDGDDVVSDDYLECLLNGARASKCDMCICGSKRFEGAFSPDKVVGGESDVFEGSIALRKMLYADGLDDSPWGLIVHRTTWGSLRFPVGRQYEDLYLMPEVYAAASRVCVIGAGLYGYRQRSGSAMHADLPSDQRLLDYEISIHHLFEIDSLAGDGVDSARDARACLEYLRLKRLLKERERSCVAEELLRRVNDAINKLLFGVLRDRNCPRELKVKCALLAWASGITRSLAVVANWVRG